MALRTATKSARRKRLYGSIQSKPILFFPAIFIQVYVCTERIASRRIEELQANIEIARAIAKGFPRHMLMMFALRNLPFGLY